MAATESARKPHGPQHHLLKHQLPAVEALEKHFGSLSPREVVKEVNKLGQKQLQAKFRELYRTQTFSNNNQWLRRKLLEAVGLQPIKVAGKARQGQHRGETASTPGGTRPTPSARSQQLGAAQGSSEGTPFHVHDVRRTSRVRKPPKVYTDTHAPRNRLGKGEFDEQHFGSSLLRFDGNRFQQGPALLRTHSFTSGSSCGTAVAYGSSPPPRLHHSSSCGALGYPDTYANAYPETYLDAAPPSDHNLVWVRSAGSLAPGRIVSHDITLQMNLHPPLPTDVLIEFCDSNKYSWVPSSEVLPRGGQQRQQLAGDSMRCRITSRNGAPALLHSPRPPPPHQGLAAWTSSPALLEQATVQAGVHQHHRSHSFDDSLMLQPEDPLFGPHVTTSCGGGGSHGWDAAEWPLGAADLDLLMDMPPTSFMQDAALHMVPQLHAGFRLAAHQASPGIKEVAVPHMGSSQLSPTSVLGMPVGSRGEVTTSSEGTPFKPGYGRVCSSDEQESHNTSVPSSPDGTVVGSAYPTTLLALVKPLDDLIPAALDDVLALEDSVALEQAERLQQRLSVVDSMLDCVAGAEERLVLGRQPHSLTPHPTTSSICFSPQPTAPDPSRNAWHRSFSMPAII